MSKKAQIIQPESGLRLKRLLETTGTSQAELSEKIHLSQQTISKIINGKAALTAAVAADIAALWPAKDDLYAWLTLQSDYQTTVERIMANAKEIMYAGDKLLTGFSCLAQQCGYDVTVNHSGRSGTEGNHNLLDVTISSFTLSKNGEIIAEMSSKEMLELEHRTFNAFKSCLENYLLYRREYVTLLEKGKIECVVDPDLEKSELRFNVESGVATIYARTEEDKRKAFRSLVDSGLI